MVGCRYNLPYWSNPPFLIFDIRALWRSRLSARAPECQKIKNGGLDQYVTGPFEQQHFGTAGIEGIKFILLNNPHNFCTNPSGSDASNLGNLTRPVLSAGKVVDESPTSHVQGTSQQLRPVLITGGLGPAFGEPHGQCGARTYYMDLGANPPAESGGQSPWSENQGLNTFCIITT